MEPENTQERVAILEEDREAASATSGEQKEPSTQQKKTLGVLFVHGIGAQQRGDTLAQCGTVIHGWLGEWMASMGEIISADFVETDLTQPTADEPAHSRLIFHTTTQVSPLYWLFVESCWAEAFRPPSYCEFVRWSFRVLPFTVIQHLVVSRRRDDRILRECIAALDNLEKRGSLDPAELWQLQADLAPRYGFLQTTDVVGLRKCLQDATFRAGNWWEKGPFLLAHLLLIAILLQAILFAMMIVGFLPIGFLRSFASRVQTKVAAVLGDSYLFVESPLSESAAVTQVKKDFEWLAGRCDKIVVLAHSQGAAVVYRALEEWSWTGSKHPKLELLITYGSGLRKLFDLQQLQQVSRNQSRAERWLTKYCMEMVTLLFPIGSIAIIIAVGLWLVGWLAFWPAALSVAVGWFTVHFGFEFANRVFSNKDPVLPVGIQWMNLFASHDPVSNGPLAVKAPEVAPSGNKYYDQAVRRMYKMLVDFFHFHQREVVNKQSTISDHTTYWSAKDDFVSRVVTELLRISELPVTAPDKEWMDVSVQRRRWRVGLRTGCRNVGILAALSLKFWPKGLILALGMNASNAFHKALASLPQHWVPDSFRNFTPPALPAGIVALLIFIWVLTAIALAGWNLWDQNEMAHFLRREPYRVRGVGVSLFAVGWVGILIAVPAATAFAVSVHGGIGISSVLSPALWTLSLLLAITCWRLVSLRKDHKQFTDWIPSLLERGESLLEQKTGDPKTNLQEAETYFCWVTHFLTDQRDSMENVRAWLGRARVIEQAEESSEDKVEKLTCLYELAIASLERMGKDAVGVRESLNRLPKTENHGQSVPLAGD